MKAENPHSRGPSEISQTANILQRKEDIRISSRPIYIVTSEREAELLRRRAHTATVHPNISTLRGEHVVLVPTSADHRQMSEWAARLLGVAAKVELFFLPGLLPGEDLRIWFGTQRAEDSDDLFTTGSRVEITSLEGIHAYLKEPEYLAIPTPELARIFVATAIRAGWTPKEALQFVTSTMGGVA